jgi:hypothetical protein
MLDPAPSQVEYPYGVQPAGNPFAPPEPAQLRWGEHWLPLAVIALATLLADFAVVPLMDVFSQRDWGALLVFVSFGMLAAQGGIVAAAIVWLIAPFWQRLVIGWLMVTVGVLAWTFGLFAAGELQINRLDDDWLIAILILPALALAIQLPLWATKQYLGWRLIAKDSEGANTPGNNSLSIRDLFGATLIAAVSLAFLRWAAGVERELWIAMGITLPSVAAIAAISLLPVAGVMLGWRQWGWGLVIIGCEALLAVVVVAVVVAIFDNGPGLRDWEYLCLATTIFAFAGTLAAAALAARIAGYRLQMGRSMPVPGEPECSAASAEKMEL